VLWALRRPGFALLMNLSMNPIHVARDGNSLGRFSDEAVVEGLADGRFRVTDLGWRDPMAGWVPLGGFPGLPEAVPAASGKVPAAGEIATQKAGQPGTIPDVPVEPAWEDRGAKGLALAAAETVAGVLSRPREIFAAMKQNGGLGAPLGFLMVMGTLTGWVSLGYQYVAARLDPAAMREALPEFFAGSPERLFVLLAVLTPVGILISTYVAAGVFHAALKVLAARVVSFEATFRVYCYVWGAASVFQLIPILGNYAHLGAAFYLTILGIRDVQRVPGGVAAAAVLLPAVLCCGLLVALAFGAPAVEGISTLR
jgi:hypothetical protein